jgi:hypothetical protein
MLNTITLTLISKVKIFNNVSFLVQMADIFQISLINYTDEVGNDY